MKTQYTTNSGVKPNTFIIFAIIYLMMSSNNISAQTAPHAYFDASDKSYIDYGRGLDADVYKDLHLGNKLSITMWVKWDSKTATGVGSWANLFTLADSSGSGDNGVFWVQHSQTNQFFEFALHTNSRTYVQSKTEPLEGTWYHLAMIYDGSLPNQNMKLYVNGVLETTQNKTGNIRLSPELSKLYMGRWALQNSQRRFNGYIDEVSVWNTALTSEEVLKIMDVPESVTGVNYDKEGLISYFDFQKGDSEDLSGNGIEGNVAENVEFKGTNNGSLPVELIDFTVENSNNNVQLFWATATEVNNDYFIIEKSNDGINGFEVDRIQGAGNSNMLLKYTWIDYSANTDEVVYYRLIQTDFDGQQRVYPWKSISSSNNNKMEVSISPNPSNGDFNLRIKQSNSVPVEVKIFDLSGRLRYSNKISEQSDYFVERISLKGQLEKGMYVLEINDGFEKNSSKIVIQ